MDGSAVFRAVYDAQTKGNAENRIQMRPYSMRLRFGRISCADRKRVDGHKSRYMWPGGMRYRRRGTGVLSDTWRGAVRRGAYMLHIVFYHGTQPRLFMRRMLHAGVRTVMSADLQIQGK